MHKMLPFGCCYFIYMFVGVSVGPFIDVCVSVGKGVIGCVDR